MLPAVAFLEPSQSDKILLRKAYVVTTWGWFHNQEDKPGGSAKADR
jgi:hypothetical protein